MFPRTIAIAAALSLLPLEQPMLLGTLGITTATTAAVVNQGAAVAQDNSADDYLVKAKAILGKNGQASEVMRLANKSLALRPSARGYSYRGYAKHDLKDYLGAINDFSKAYRLIPRTT